MRQQQQTIPSLNQSRIAPTYRNITAQYLTNPSLGNIGYNPRQMPGDLAPQFDRIIREQHELNEKINKILNTPNKQLVKKKPQNILKMFGPGQKQPHSKIPDEELQKFFDEKVESFEYVEQKASAVQNIIAKLMKYVLIIVFFIINVVLIIPISYILLTYCLIKQFKILFQQKESLLQFIVLLTRYIFGYILDTFTFCCVYGMIYYVFSSINQENDMYQVWCMNYLIVFFSLEMFQSASTVDEDFDEGDEDIETVEDFEEKKNNIVTQIAIKLISKSWVDDNVYTLTDEELVRQLFYKEQNQVQNSKYYLQKAKDLIVENKLNIDLSLFYFDFIGNKLDLPRSQISNEKEQLNPLQLEIIEKLKQLGSPAKMCGGYHMFGEAQRQAKIYYYQSEKTSFLFIIGFIFCEIASTLTGLILFEDKHLQIFPVILIVGISLYISHRIDNIFYSQDLQCRLKLFRTINQYVDFSDLESEEKYQENLNIIRQKLDITCDISIESWDNARRITLHVYSTRTELFDLLIMFLGLYYAFLLLVCVSIYGQFYYVIAKDSIYNQPPLLLHTTVDFLLLTVLFLARIYYGQIYNDIFDEQISNIEKLMGIYEDLYQMQEKYFNEDLIKNIEDNLTKMIVMKINQKAEFYRSINLNNCAQNFDKQKIINKILDLNRKTLKKTKTSIKVDEKEQKYQLFGMFSIDFFDALSTVIFSLASVFPLVLQKLLEIFGINEE